MRPPLIFLSYRRQDTGPYALALRSELELRLDGIPIFLDLNRIQGGDLWEEVLDDALTKAKVLIALIGPNWAGELETGGTRLDSEGDWVRKEVARALRHSPKAVLPVLVNDARIPDPQSLPSNLRKLFDIQAMPLRSQSWDADVAALCAALESAFSVRVKRLGELLPTPNPLKQREGALTDGELKQDKRDGLLPGWEVELMHDAEKTGYVRESLRKKFTCASDVEAFDFVSRIQPLTKTLKHHPKIEMIFKTVVIRLSTFDAGYRITTFDRRMAVEIDELFNRLRHSRASQPAAEAS